MVNDDTIVELQQRIDRLEHELGIQQDIHAIPPFHFDHPVTGKPIRIDNSRAREGFNDAK